MIDLKEQFDSSEIQTGEQTQITESVLKIAQQINGESDELIENISKFLNNYLKTYPSSKYDSQRSVDEIIKSRNQKGCNEVGVVFLSLLRAKGINASYIQTFLKEDLEKYNPTIDNNRVNGHVFLRVKNEDNYKIVNSTLGKITQEIPNEYIFGKEGLDSWDIGLRDSDDYIRLFEETKKQKNL